MTNYISSPVLRVSDQNFGLALVANPENSPTQLPTYLSPNGTIWVGGRVGQEYGVELIVPDSGGRYGALLTVDGLNSQTGRPSTGDMRQESFWVVSPPTRSGKNIIPGWTRPGGEKAAKFVFSTVGDSYVGKMDLGAENAGVIGVRFAHEFQAPVIRAAYRGGAKSFGEATRGGGLGTGYGSETEFRVRTTQFEIDPLRPIVTLVIRYAIEQKLLDAGYQRIADRAELSETPNPFPASIAGVPAPAGWRS